MFTISCWYKISGNTIEKLPVFHSSGAEHFQQNHKGYRIKILLDHEFFSCFFQTGQAIWLNQCWHNPIPCSMKQLGALLLPLDEILVSNSLHAQVPPPTLPQLCPNSSPVTHSHSLQGVNGILWRGVVLPLDKLHWCQHRWFCLVLQHLITNLSRTTL